MSTQSNLAVDNKGLMKFSDKLVSFVLIVLPFFLPFFKPAVSIGLGALVALALFHLVFSQDSRDKALVKCKAHRNLFLVYLFILIWILASAFWSEAEDRFYRVFRFNEMLLVPFICLVFREEIRIAFRWMLTSLVLGSTIAGLVTIWFVIFPDSVPIGEGYWYLLKRIPEDQDFLRFGAYSPFLDRLYYSYLTGGLILALVFRYFIQKNQLWIYVPLLILFPVFFFLGGRGAQLAFILALTSGLLFIWVRKKSFHQFISSLYLKRIFLVYTVALGGLLALLAFSEKFSLRYAQLRWELKNYASAESLDESYRFQTVVLRLVSWEHNLKLLHENPVVGTGVGDYRTSMSRSYQNAGIDLPAHTNQQFLYFGVIGGIPLLIMFLWFFAGSFRTVYKSHVPQIQLAGVVWWVYMLVVMFFDSPLNYQMPAFFFLLIWFSLFFISGSTGDERIKRSPLSADHGDG